jgi:hypothetical protein
MVTPGNGHLWRSTAFGLYVPADTVDQPDGNVPAAGSEKSAGSDHPESAAIDRGMLQATRRQAWGTVLGAFAGVSALIVTVFALVISAAAWNGQRELNRQQAQLNSYAQESQREVYSSRVAMWAAVGESIQGWGVTSRFES